MIAGGLGVPFSFAPTEGKALMNGLSHPSPGASQGASPLPLSLLFRQAQPTCPPGSTAAGLSHCARYELEADYWGRGRRGAEEASRLKEGVSLKFKLCVAFVCTCLRASYTFLTITRVSPLDPHHRNAAHFWGQEGMGSSDRAVVRRSSERKELEAGTCTHVSGG